MVYMANNKKREPARLVGSSELARRLGTKPDTVRRWARSGLIPCYRVGMKSLRFDFAEICEALRSVSPGEVRRAK